MRVGLIAPPWVPVPPPVYGGTELVVDQLARGLTAAGCDVTLFTTGDATCPVRRRWLHPHALGTTLAPGDELAHVEQAYKELAGMDLIHDHSFVGPLYAAVNDVDVPVVCTVHGPLHDGARAHYARAAAKVGVVAISGSQRRGAPEVPITAVIHHGIDVDGFPLGAGDGGYVLFLGRMSPDKGAHRAIAIARSAGKRIVLAAKMWEPDELRYFAGQVEPLLGDDATYVGEVGGAAKVDLLCGAEALVNPIRWREPFGLVMVEALACGTPVLAFREGSAAEIVDHGRTGYLCGDDADMAAALAHVGELDRAACRAAARLRFSTARMVEDHLRLYRRHIAVAAAREVVAASRVAV